MVRTARRTAGWDAAIRWIGNHETNLDTYCSVDLSEGGIRVLPDLEIKSCHMLNDLAASMQAEDMGLMDLVIYEEGMVPRQRS